MGDLGHLMAGARVGMTTMTMVIYGASAPGGPSFRPIACTKKRGLRFRGKHITDSLGFKIPSRTSRGQPSALDDY